jgi:hypothetical protein
MIVEYPDGRAVYPGDSPVAANASIEEYVAIRVADMKFVLDSLAKPSVTSRIPGLGGATSPLKTNMPHLPKPKLQTNKIGVFGHSLGGAAALQLMSEDKRFHVGANLDGGLFGSVIPKGIDSPFVFFGRPDHNRHSDDTWAEAWPNIRGFKREYMINGSTHATYTDLPVFRDLLGDKFPSEYILGTVNGTRILNIETAFLGALFNRFLKGYGGELLDGKGLNLWPEVALVK